MIFCRIKETSVRGFVCLGSLPHNRQEVVYWIESASARAERMLQVVQAHSTCNPLRAELGEQLFGNREKRKWSVVRAVPHVTTFGEMHYNSRTPYGRHATGRKEGIE